MCFAHAIALYDSQIFRAGAAAFRYLTTRLPRLFPLAPLMHLPFTLPIWKWGYRQVAKRRYLAGKTTNCDDGSCAVHFKK